MSCVWTYSDQSQGLHGFSCEFNREYSFACFCFVQNSSCSIFPSNVTEVRTCIPCPAVPLSQSFFFFLSLVQSAVVYHTAYLADYCAFLYTNFKYIIKPSCPVSLPLLSLSCGVVRKPGILIELSPRIASSFPASCPQALEYSF